MTDVNRNDVQALTRAIIAAALIQSKAVDLSGAKPRATQSEALSSNMQQLKLAVDAVMEGAVENY